VNDVSTMRDWALALKEEYGKLTPEIVREAARPVDSPAHGFVFNCSPDEAAEQFYLERAHKLIQTIRVTVQPTPESPRRTIRLFHAIPGTEDAVVYETIDVIAGSKVKLEELRKAAHRRLHDAQSSIEDIEAIAHSTEAQKAIAAVQQARGLLTG
jgi:hypothetical protein